MPYTHNLDFAEPQDRDVRIWRYLDIPKLLDLLHRRSLWFAAANRLGDPEEGSFGSMNEQMRPTVYSEAGPQVLDVMRRFRERLAGEVYVNCWHMAEHESDLMWSRYVPSGHGIAIVSTFSRLTESFLSDDYVTAAVVQYVDRDTTWISEGQALRPFSVKDIAFRQEAELRAIVHMPMEAPASDAGGLRVNVDLDALIERVVFAPGMTSWEVEAIAAASRTLGLTAPVIGSRRSRRVVF